MNTIYSKPKILRCFSFFLHSSRDIVCVFTCIFRTNKIACVYLKYAKILLTFKLENKSIAEKTEEKNADVETKNGNINI